MAGQPASCPEFLLKYARRATGVAPVNTCACSSGGCSLALCAGGSLRRLGHNPQVHNTKPRRFQGLSYYWTDV